MGHILDPFPVFGELDQASKDLILEDLHDVRIKLDRYLFEEGAPSKGMYLLCSGEVEIQKTINGQKDVAIARIKPHSVFGETSLLFNHKRNASAYIVNSDAVLLLWPTKKFEKFIQNNPKAAVKMLMALCRVIVGRLISRNEEVLKTNVIKKKDEDTGELTIFRKKLFNDWSF